MNTFLKSLILFFIFALLVGCGNDTTPSEGREPIFTSKAGGVDGGGGNAIPDASNKQGIISEIERSRKKLPQVLDNFQWLIANHSNNGLASMLRISLSATLQSLLRDRELMEDLIHSEIKEVANFRDIEFYPDSSIRLFLSNSPCQAFDSEDHDPTFSVSYSTGKICMDHNALLRLPQEAMARRLSGLFIHELVEYQWYRKSQNRIQAARLGEQAQLFFLSQSHSFGFEPEVDFIKSHLLERVRTQVTLVLGIKCLVDNFCPEVTLKKFRSIRSGSLLFSPLRSSENIEDFLRPLPLDFPNNDIFNVEERFCLYWENKGLKTILSDQSLMHFKINSVLERYFSGEIKKLRLGKTLSQGINNYCGSYHGQDVFGNQSPSPVQTTIFLAQLNQIKSQLLQNYKENLDLLSNIFLKSDRQALYSKVYCSPIDQGNGDSIFNYQMFDSEIQEVIDETCS